MAVNYQKAYERLDKMVRTNIDDIDINGNISVSDIDTIIGYCKLSDSYYMEEISRKLEKRLLKKDYLPGRFGGFNYDFETNKMTLILEYALGAQEKYVFERVDKDIILLDATYKDKGQRLLPLIGDFLHELADYSIKINDFKTLKERIKSTDGNFVIDLNGEVIKVITEGATIKLSYDEYGCDKQDVASNSLEISKLVKQNTEKLLKRIRINISDCPKWMQNELTHMNEKELKKREDKNKIRKIFKR